MTSINKVDNLITSIDYSKTGLFAGKKKKRETKSCKQTKYLKILTGQRLETKDSQGVEL